MYTITRLRLWLAQRAFGLRKAPALPLETRPRFRPSLAVMEDRLPPGDVLWSAVAGMRGMEAGPAAPAVVRGLDAPAVKSPPAATLRSVLPEMTAREPVRKAPLPAPEISAPKSAELPGVEPVSVRPFAAADDQLPQKAATAAADGPAAPYIGAAAPATFAVPSAPEPAKDAFSVGGPRVDGGTAAPAPKKDTITVTGGGVTPTLPASETSPPAPLAAPANTRGTEPRRTDTALPIPVVSGVKGGTAKPGSFTYAVPGATVTLAPKPDTLAVQLTDETGDGLAALTGKGGALEGATLVRWAVTGKLAVVAGPGLADRVGTVKDAGVAFTVPVYVEQSSGAELVIVNEVLVKLTDPGTAAAFFAANGFAGYRGVAGTADVFIATVADGYGKPVLDAIARLRGVAGVAYAEPNGYENVKLSYDPNDAEYAAGNMWHIKNTGQGGGLPDADIDLDLAWDVNPGGSSTMVFADVDEGIDFTNPDLTPWVNPGEIAGDGKDNDGNGWVDDINGWNFVSNNNIVTPTLNNTLPNNTGVQSHGTATAGLLAAKGDNTIGVVGGSYKGQVMAVRIFEDGIAAPTTAGIVSGLLYAAGKKADGTGTWTSARVMNNSWGGGLTSATLNDALTWAAGTGHTGTGIPTFFAAGNAGTEGIGYPMSQALTTPGMVVVGMMGSDGRPSYSSYGAGLDLITVSDSFNANTLLVNTTDRTGAEGYNTDPIAGDYTGTGATGFGGTSAASPMAAGVGGLVLSQAASKSVTITAAQLDAYLRNNTDIVGAADVGSYDISTGINLVYGAGRLNAFDAVNNVGRAEVDVMSGTAKVASGFTADFGAAEVGGAATQTFRVRNGGTKQLDLSALAVTGASYSIAAGFSDPTLTIGESATFTVRFSPTAAAAAAGQVTFASNDADEGTYTINFTGTGKYASVGGRVFEDWNGNGVLDVNDPGIPDRSVYLDLNNNGTLDPAPTATDFFSAPLMKINDNTTQTATQTVSGLGASDSIADVNVKLNISHTWDSDLIVSLVSPAGTEVLLFSGVGGKFDNFVDTVLDDEATTPIASGAAPFTGSFIPQGALAAFDSEPATGKWSLKVTDTASGDDGVLQNWTLTIRTSEPAALSDANGDYRFYDLAPATYVVRQVLPAGWTGTGAASQSVVVTATSTNTTTNFGSGFNNSFYTNVYNDKNGNGSKNAGELPLAGQKVFLDGNANGTFDTGGTATGSNTTPLTVPDGTGQFVFSDIVISGASPDGVADVNVTLTATHTWDEDLYVFLVAPSGGFIQLFGNIGSNGDNFTNTTLDDEAATFIADGANGAPYTGSFKPNNGTQGKLSDFDGGLANGTWRLALADVTGGDVGILQNWSLSIALAESNAVTDALGNAYLDLPAGGPYTLKLVQPTGFLYTAPSTGTYAVNAAGAPLFNNYYGVAVAPAVATVAVNGGAAQRSRVTSVTVTFNSPVTLTAGAFTFTRVGTYDGGAGDNKTISDGGAGPLVTVTPSVDGGGNTVATLTFTNGGSGAVVGKSLADGRWTLTVDKSKVQLGALAPAADFVTPASGAGRIFRIFGDIDGNGQVNPIDYQAFDATFGLSSGDAGYLAPFDSDNNNQINPIDYQAFDANFGLTM